MSVCHSSSISDPTAVIANAASAAGSSSFVTAVDAYDLLVRFVGERRYTPDEAAEVVKALRTLRLALIQPPATPQASEAAQ